MKDKVLIVEDMEINRAVLGQILHEKYQVLEAQNGREAMEILEEQHDELAIVLLDLIMPEMDGFEVLQIMNDKGWMKSLPVLVITGEDSAEIEGKCYEYGVSDVITKPFNYTLVQLRVGNIVSLFKYKRELEKLDALDALEMLDDLKGTES